MSGAYIDWSTGYWFIFMVHLLGILYLSGYVMNADDLERFLKWTRNEIFLSLFKAPEIKLGALFLYQ